MVIINLLICEILKNSIEINGQKPKLISNFLDIKLAYDGINTGKIKFLYFNRKQIEEILYQYDEIIEIKDLEKKISLSEYFYLDLLINENLNIINYIYNINIIIFLNEYNKQESFPIKKVIISKIIIDLIYYYKDMDFYSSEDDLQLNSIEQSNIMIIKDNNNILDVLGNSFKKKEKIDLIYIKLFIYFAKNRKFNNYDYIYKIIKELDYESINITQNMFEELKKELDINNNYAKYYNIRAVEDLNDIEKVNFYYILFKYILKTSFYIYYIPFLLNLKKNFIHMIKNDLNNLIILLNLKDNIIREKIEYLLKMIPDSEFYYIKHLKYREINLLKEVLQYYKNFLFESKEEDIKEIEKIIEKKTVKENIQKYLKDLEIAKKMNERLPIITNLYKLDNKDQDNLNNEKEMNKYVEAWLIVEKAINGKKIKNIKNKQKISLIKFFLDKNNEETLLKIFSKDIYDYFIEENLELYKLKHNIDENEGKNKNENNPEKNSSIWFQDTKSNTKKIKNNKDVSNINNENNSSENSLKEEEIQNKNFPILENKSEENISNSDEEEEDDLKYKIIDIINIIGYHDFAAEFVKEISNGFIISGGYDKKINIYNDKFNKIIQVKDFNDTPNSVYEISKNKKEKEKIYKLIVCCRQEIYFIILDLEENKVNISKKILPHISNIICIEARKNSYLISGETGVYYFSNLENSEKPFHSKKVLEKPYKSGIKISKNIIALTSNNILPNGKDEIIFYNTNKKEISKTIQNYSFITTINGLCLMNIDERNKILLCACKKYFPNQRNGILLINPQIDNRDIINPFYDTDQFEVYNFCQIYLNNNKSYSNYFLVGGFDVQKREGMLKLYKLVCNEKIYEAKIKYILDIQIEKKGNFKGFERPINCIIQSKKNGNIIASSWDGNIFLFTHPNLNFFLFNNLNVKSDNENGSEKYLE